MNFIGQKGQDEWVIKDIFDYKRDGYFVDLAAYDGVDCTNTLLMEQELGWTGICIEANPIWFSALSENRTCYLSNDVIDFKDGNEVVYRIDNGGLAGIVDEDTDNNTKYRAHELQSATLIRRQTRTLEYILRQFNAPDVIDYLSLDVEGAETRVLKNFPFDKYIQDWLMPAHTHQKNSTYL